MNTLDAAKAEIGAFLASCQEGVTLLQAAGIEVTDTPQEIAKWKNMREFAIWNWGCVCALQRAVELIDERVGDELLEGL